MTLRLCSGSGNDYFKDELERRLSGAEIEVASAPLSHWD